MSDPPDLRADSRGSQPADPSLPGLGEAQTRASTSDSTEALGAAEFALGLEYERAYWDRGVHLLAGVDEVGRGPLAGPVMAAAVILNPELPPIPGIRDSKQLDLEARLELDGRIRETALAWGLGAASVREIDRLNILRATRLAMERALRAAQSRLPRPLDHVVIDGLPMKGLAWEHDAVVKGDDRVVSVACASILAKVCRDRLMGQLAPRYPAYGWERNVGYGTGHHRDALRSLGPTPHHRVTFGLEQMSLFESADVS